MKELGFTQYERDLLEAMNELDLVLMSRQSRGELHGGTWKIADHGALAEELLQKLELEKEVPVGGAMLGVQGIGFQSPFHLEERGVKANQV